MILFNFLLFSEDIYM